MRRLLSGPLAALAIAMAIAACKVQPRIEDRPVVVYAPAACPVAQSNAYSVILGNGDFPNPEDDVSSLFLRDVGTTLSELPPDTRSLTIDVSLSSANEEWRGTSEVPASGPVNVLVWPVGAQCSLSQSLENRTDGSFGTFGSHLMVAGGSLPGSVPHTFVGDLSTGAFYTLQYGLGTRRSRATITAFQTSADEEPSPALVAGGEDPDTGTPIGTAEVYQPDSSQPGGIGDFSANRIDLSEPRTRHGAVTLASGEVLLVGGIGQFGTPLATMEIVNPTKNQSRTNGVALLQVARSDPTVLRLASGEILVAGGVDKSNTPIETLEWFAPDASAPSKRATPLVTGRERAFVPLEAGGALAVIIPADNSDPTFNTVWVISADGTLEAGAPINPDTLNEVRLYPGASGAPVLWTGLQWQRWQPWAAAFQPIADAPSVGPTLTSIANGDSGLALWLDNSSEQQLFVTGFRFDTQSRFGPVASPLLVTGTFGVAPDRIAGKADSALRFDTTDGLQLGYGASAFVTDETFADVTVELDTTGASAIVLREDDGTELSIGGAECPYSVAPTSSLRVERTGNDVHYSIDDGDLKDCGASLTDNGRVHIGVRGANNTGNVSAKNLRITRR